jgi:hypothetical protein
MEPEKNHLTKRIAQSLTCSASDQGSSSTRTKNVYCATENRVLEREANRFWNRIHQIMTDSMTGECPQENFFLPPLPTNDVHIFDAGDEGAHARERNVSSNSFLLSQFRHNAENEE